MDLHTTGRALATLKILGYDMDETKSCAKPIKRAAKYFRKSRSDIDAARGGQLAYIVMGLQALCEDPGDYEGMNLTKNLLQDLMHFPKGKFALILEPKLNSQLVHQSFLKPNMLSAHNHKFSFRGTTVALNIDDSYPQQFLEEAYSRKLLMISEQNGQFQ